MTNKRGRTTREHLEAGEGVRILGINTCATAQNKSAYLQTQEGARKIRKKSLFRKKWNIHHPVKTH